MGSGDVGYTIEEQDVLDVIGDNKLSDRRKLDKLREIYSDMFFPRDAEMFDS